MFFTHAVVPIMKAQISSTGNRKPCPSRLHLLLMLRTKSLKWDRRFADSMLEEAVCCEPVSVFPDAVWTIVAPD